MRIAAAGRSTTTVPTTLQGPGVFASAADGPFWIVEVGVFNTTITAVAVGLAVCTATGTQAGGLTEYVQDNPAVPAPTETAFTQMSTNATVAATIRQASLGAAIGSGVIWTFGDRGLFIPEGTGNGVIINCPTGTGQHLDFHLVWDK
jgi:hypothetical protein